MPMVYHTTSTNTPLLDTVKNYSNYREATDHLSLTILETKRWIEEGVIKLESDELEAYLKFVIVPAVVAGKASNETIKKLANTKNTFKVG